MVTRVEIAQANAHVARALLWGEPVREELRAASAVGFADAADAVHVLNVRPDEVLPQTFDFRGITGVHANGYDFGPHHDQFRLTANDPPPTPDQERAIIDGLGSRERYEEAKRRVARGELDAIIRRTRSNALSAALTLVEAASWIGASTDQVLASLEIGELLAFVCDNDLRLPAWQFTAEPDSPTLRHIAKLIPHFQPDQHPATILGFMMTTHGSTRLDGASLTPVVWLLSNGDPQPLIDMLDSFLMS